MPLPYGSPIPADALAASAPEVSAPLNALTPELGEPLGETPVLNGLSEPFEPLPGTFCAELPELFEPFSIDPFLNKLAVLAVVATAAACVTVIVYGVVTVTVDCDPQTPCEPPTLPLPAPGELELPFLRPLGAPFPDDADPEVDS